MQSAPQPDCRRTAGSHAGEPVGGAGGAQILLQTRVSNDNPYSESLFRTVKYRPDYPRRPFRSQEEGCSWACAFLDWYNHRHRHSSIRFVTPDQRHSGQAVELCRQRARVYEQARQRHPRYWSRGTRCWCQPGVVWINPPLPDNAIDPATLVMAA
nr:integrase core domain-containing protein [Synechococcus sp. CCY 9618]